MCELCCRQGTEDRAGAYHAKQLPYLQSQLLYELHRCALNQRILVSKHRQSFMLNTYADAYSEPWAPPEALNHPEHPQPLPTTQYTRTPEPPPKTPKPIDPLNSSIRTPPKFQIPSSHKSLTRR